MEQVTHFTFVDMAIVKTENECIQNTVKVECENFVDTEPGSVSANRLFVDENSNPPPCPTNEESITSCGLIVGRPYFQKLDVEDRSKEGSTYSEQLLLSCSSSLDGYARRNIIVKGDMEEGVGQACMEEDNGEKSFIDLLPLVVTSSEDLNIEPTGPAKNADGFEEITKEEFGLENNTNIKNEESSYENKENVNTDEEMSVKIKDSVSICNGVGSLDIGNGTADLSQVNKISSEFQTAKRGRGRPRVLFKKTHPCSICQKVFSRKTHLTTHLRIHSDEKPYLCNLCGKSFRDNSVLIKHVRVHTQDKPYVCTVCAKAFNQKGNMERHARQHTNEKPYSCSVCQNAFSNKSHLQRHFRIHIDEKPFVCKLCDKSFRQKSHLMRHVLVHSREKPYPCNQCGKKFRQEQHVTRHKKTHVKEMITNILLKSCVSKAAIQSRYF